MIVGAPAQGGARPVTEVFDLSNDSSVTRVAADDSPRNAVWSVILPERARHPVVNDGDVTAQGVKFEGGRALIYAPFAPGLKQLVFSYTLPANAFPLSVPLQRATSVLELLVEEPEATIRGARLRAMPPVIVEGRHFLRYLASDAPANAVVTIDVARGEAPISTWYVAGLTIVIGGVMTAVLARAVRRR